MEGRVNERLAELRRTKPEATTADIPADEMPQMGPMPRTANVRASAVGSRQGSALDSPREGSQPGSKPGSTVGSLQEGKFRRQMLTNLQKRRVGNLQEPIKTRLVLHLLTDFQNLILNQVI
jgi:hypothetical protein